MGEVSVDRILITPIDRINVKGGDIVHGMKASDAGFAGFGEAYFSFIEMGAIKAWKKHLKMTLNLVVPVGRVGFNFLDSGSKLRSEIIGVGRLVRLTVPPGIWFGFKGLSEHQNIVMNMANLEHDDREVIRHNVSYFNCDWDILK